MIDPYEQADPYEAPDPYGMEYSPTVGAANALVIEASLALVGLILYEVFTH